MKTEIMKQNSDTIVVSSTGTREANKAVEPPKTTVIVVVVVTFVLLGAAYLFDLLAEAGIVFCLFFVLEAFAYYGAVKHIHKLKVEIETLREQIGATPETSPDESFVGMPKPPQWDTVPKGPEGGE